VGIWTWLTLYDDSTPGQFTEKIFDLSQQKGLVYVRGRPSRLQLSASSLPEALEITLESDGQASVLPCTDLIITAGPWTASVLSTLGLPALPLGTLPGHSVIIRAPANHEPSATAVFASIYGANRRAPGGGAAPPARTTESPELFPRANGTVYIAGENDAAPMPDHPRDVEAAVDADVAERLGRAMAHISRSTAAGTIVARQACRAAMMRGVADLRASSVTGPLRLTVDPSSASSRTMCGLRRVCHA
jgi:glycine/D-amino acid oxidase-like deaminating enzyme